MQHIQEGGDLMLDHMLFDSKKWFLIDTTKQGFFNGTFSAIPSHIKVKKGTFVIDEKDSNNVQHIYDDVAILPCLGIQDERYIVGRRGSELAWIDKGAHLTVTIGSIAKKDCIPIWGVKPS